jgi:hypothetical protein
LNLSVDDAFVVVALMPLVMLAIRRTTKGNAVYSFAALSGLLTFLFFVTFLQGLAYALILFVAYASWRAARARLWTPILILGAALAVAVLIASARLGTVAQELSLLHRPSGTVFINPLEILRLFHDGIFGDSATEVAQINGFFNPYEGIRLCVSGLATFLVCLALIRRFDGKWFPLLPAKTDDAPFFFLFFIGVVSVLSVLPLQKILNAVFLNQYLLHGRFGAAALLPLCALVAVLLRDLGAVNSADAVGGNAIAARSLGWAVGLLICILVPHIAVALEASFSLPQALRWGDPQYGLWPFATKPLLIALLQGAFCITAITSVVVNPSTFRSAMLVSSVGAAMLFSAVQIADFRVNSPQTMAGSPFHDMEFLTAKADDLLVPSDSAVTALQRRLETNNFRSVVVAPSDKFPGSISPHIAQFWRIRLLEGYINGLPRRVLALPWPSGVQGVRTIHFTNSDQLYWPLLAMMNVKYAIQLNEDLYFNRGQGLPDMLPSQVQINESPIPVTPRLFWAQAVESVSSLDESAKAIERGALPDISGKALAKMSYVEGLANKKYDARGSINAEFNGDRVVVRVEKSGAARFLVINEMFHPSWRASANNHPLEIYPTNLIMRGVEVPPGVSEVEFHFEPFASSRAAGWLAIGGFVLAALTMLLLRLAARGRVKTA